MFRKLVSLEEARKALSRSFSPKPVGTEQIPLSEALNRTLASDVTSKYDIPPFDRSTVDGYAVKAADTFGADEDKPVTLKLCGEIRIGEPPKITIQKGETAQIVTGAPIPEGTDSVVMVEYTVQNGANILIHSAVGKGENVMKAGSDIRRGELVLKRGTMLSSHGIGVLAAIGKAKVEVFKRPKVAIFSTGAEIVEPGEPLSPGKIFDINAHALSAAVAECGGEPMNMGIVQDESEPMEAALKKALSKADVVITSGGVSVGPTDIIPKVLGKLGSPGVIVYGIAVRPGKPTAIAVVGDKPVFSLPGHPTSALLLFHLLVHSVISAMAGRPEKPAVKVEAVTSEKLFPARGRRTFVTVTLRRSKQGKLVASPVPTGSSGAITTLAKADGFVEISENQQFVDAGEAVVVQLFKPNRYYELLMKRERRVS
jgi:molybdenum cofactor synthesis domain-containing protein